MNSGTYLIDRVDQDLDGNDVAVLEALMGTSASGYTRTGDFAYVSPGYTTDLLAHLADDTLVGEYVDPTTITSGDGYQPDDGQPDAGQPDDGQPDDGQLDDGLGDDDYPPETDGQPDDTDIGILSVSGQLSITDADVGEAAFQVETVSGSYGALAIDAAGSWTYTVDNALADIQGLGEGDTLTDTVSVRSVDGTTQDITLTIVGTYDANIPPEISGDLTASLSEDVSVIDGNLVASGQLSITDVDVGDAAFQVETVSGLSLIHI